MPFSRHLNIFSLEFKRTNLQKVQRTGGGGGWGVGLPRGWDFEALK